MKKETTEFKPNYRHKTYGLLAEIDFATRKYRFKGLADSSPSRWKTLRITADGIEYMTIMDERMYPCWNFVPCTETGDFKYDSDKERYGKYL